MINIFRDIFFFRLEFPCLLTARLIMFPREINVRDEDATDTKLIVLEPAK